MEQQLVSFKQAEELKELGFPQNEPMPSLELVANWMREKKNVFITVKPFFIHNYNNPIDIKYQSEVETISNNRYYAPFGSKLMDTYEEALSASIDKAIDFLKKNTTTE